MEALFFYMFAAVIMATGLLVIMFRNPLYSAVSLIVCMFAIAGEFVLLGAHFLAASQVLVYAGAVMVLFIFVIMLINPRPEDVAEKKSPLTIIGGLLGILFFLSFAITLIFASRSGEGFPDKANVPVDFGSTEQVGRVIFSEYLFPFEAAGILLFVGIVGVVVLSKHMKRGKEASE